MVKRSGALRREHFVVLLSHRCPTNDAMSAFVQSVDQIVNIADIANFRPVLRRGVAQHDDTLPAFPGSVARRAGELEIRTENVPAQTDESCSRSARFFARFSETPVAAPSQAVVISALPHMKLVRWVRFNWDLDKLPALGDAAPAALSFHPGET